MCVCVWERERERAQFAQIKGSKIQKCLNANLQQAASCQLEFRWRRIDYIDVLRCMLSVSRRTCCHHGEPSPLTYTHVLSLQAETKLGSLRMFNFFSHVVPFLQNINTCMFQNKIVPDICELFVIRNSQLDYLISASWKHDGFHHPDDTDWYMYIAYRYFNKHSETPDESFMLFCCYPCKNIYK